MVEDKKKNQVHFQLHPKQAEVFNNDCRFRVVVAGRRFGKTKLSMLTMLAWATKKNQKIWYVAPTYKMAKQIMWNDLKSWVPREWVSKTRENELSMEFRNGSRIDLKGADKPDSLRGVSLDYLVLDEFQDIDPVTWKTVLRPTLADRKGHALFIGCVRGDTRVLSDTGIKTIEGYCKNAKPKSLEPLKENLYGLNREFHETESFWNNGVVETRKITTRCGFELEASLPHPIWTVNKYRQEWWKRCGDLKQGDFVVIARGMERWGNKVVIDSLAYQAGRDSDGGDFCNVWNYTRTTAAYFLSGYFDKFGSLNVLNRSISCQFEKKKNAQDLQLLLTNFGVISKIEPLDDSDRIYVLKVERENLYMLVGILHLREEAKLSLLTGAMSVWLKEPIENQEEPYFYDTIETIEKSEAQTYDFIIPDTHSFWSNGFISHNTPKGFNLLYEVYRLGQNKQKQMTKQWMSWQFPTITSPFIPKAEIEAARRDMDEKSFRQEFCHLPETKVLLWGGASKKIKRLMPGDVLSYVDENGQLKPCKVTDKRNTGKRLILEAKVGDGSIVRASVDHKLKINGQKVSLAEAHEIERWKNGELIRIPIISKRLETIQDTINITVDSPDHSYLLADGTNNYNCASFESMSGRVYYAFDRKTHVADVEFNPKLPIWVGMDFNIDPMSTVIFQPQPDGKIFAVDEIVQIASNTDDICAELEKRYYKYQNQVTIYPDPAGSARQHARGESDLDIIREHGFKRIKVKRAHSAVADRVNAVNRVLRTASGEIRLFINPKCKHLIESFEQTLYIAGTRDVDKSLGVEHSADAAGYCIEIEFPLRKFTPAGFSY